MTYIAQHEHVFRVPYQLFHENWWVKRQGTTPPSIAEATGNVNAYINHGRWLVDCPSEACGNAVVVTEKVPFFLCTMCGPRTNEGRWFNVSFPDGKNRIEEALLKRSDEPLMPWRPFQVASRNWIHTETVSDLNAENRKHGIR